ncbi:kinase-like protein [Patellaria atrata CBS 101060]|uniref:Kinase-like protein n=1 Tax=Patellaria atrata CBS 101060 TaxID=1346257 RepID=A0A9P4S8Y1_9PEZI|nr:kinase-like protein [Patellaria atrata CBS 101060]
MAPEESQHSFQKLKLDTAPAKPLTSTFSSLSRENSNQNGITQCQSRNQSSTIPTSDLASSFPGQDIDNDEGQKRPSADLYLSESVVLSPADDVESSFRNRSKSITFADEVTLDSGHRQSAHEPLPKPEHESSSPLRRNFSESEKFMFDPATGEPLDQRKARYRHFRAGEMRHPLLQTTVDDLARDSGISEHEQIASLTSEATASPILEEVKTPEDIPAEYLLSPLTASSPMDFASRHGAWPITRRTSEQRSRSSRSEKSSFGSQRRNTRRSTGRSAASSMSPASAFLSQWGREEAASLTEPDDEGQEIGDHSEYIIGRQIGFGGFSVVKEVFTIENSKKITRAVKIVRKQVNGKSEHENDKLQTDFEHEVSIWRFLKHRYILPLIAVYDSPFATFCITKLNTGGTLFDLVRSNRKVEPGKRGLTHDLARRYVYQLASALRYLHEDVRVVHRDIKLENCLLDMSGLNSAKEGGNVLLCDFGMADFITNEHRPEPEQYDNDRHANIGPSELSSCVVGSLQYAAPELFNARTMLYEPSVDIWAFGVIVFALLTGELPFQHSFQPKLTMMILKGEWDRDLLINARGSSEEAVDLVQGCLQMDPLARPTIGDILENPWLDGCKEICGDVDGAWA